MNHRISLVQEAEDDLLDIYEYAARTRSTKDARSLLNAIKKTCRALSKLPLRGHYPLELERVGITLYREIHHPPFRIIYEVLAGEVLIHAIFDGRRNMRDILERRLLRGG